MRRKRSARIAIRVNGQPLGLDLPASTTLADLLRSELRLTGTKEGCGVGECGACTVLVDDEPMLSCLMLAAEAGGRRITTIECDDDPRLERLREAFLEESAFQCGFCTPGMVLAASRLPAGASAAAIRAALVGNLCRCTGYTKIVRAVQRAGRKRASRAARG